MTITRTPATALDVEGDFARPVKKTSVLTWSVILTALVLWIFAEPRSEMISAAPWGVA